MLGCHFTFLVALASFALPTFVSAGAIPIARGSGGRFVRKVAKSAVVSRSDNTTSDFDVLVQGNEKFKENVDPALLKELTENGQHPPFMFIGCSDSRVAEGTIFDAAPGTLFTERNIANQFNENDGNTNAVLSYAVDVLGVKHVIVMGHYGCGGVAAAIATPPEGIIDASGAAIQSWILPIRQLYNSTTRPEVVALREANKGKKVVEEPEIHEPGFRALVEENVKVNVARIAAGSTFKNHSLRTAEEKIAARSEGQTSQQVFVHGFVYDIENGNIVNLKVSVGPSGVPIPDVPFPAVQAVLALENASSEPHVAENEKRTACESQCQSKRSFRKEE